MISSWSLLTLTAPAVLSLSVRTGQQDQLIFPLQDQYGDRGHLSQWQGHTEVDMSAHTLREILTWTLTHPDDPLEIHKFSWIVNKTSEIKEGKDDEVKWKGYLDYLKEAEQNERDVAILAVGDEFVKKPKHGGDDEDKDDSFGDPDQGMLNPFNDDFFNSHHHHHDKEHHHRDDSNDYNINSVKDKEEEEHHQFLLRVALAVLSYQTLRHGHSHADLLDLSTASTWLPSSVNKDKEGKTETGVPFRVSLVKSGTVVKDIEVNRYAKIVKSVKAKNGYIHIVDNILLPPPTILNELLLFPSVYSTLTSSVLQTLLYSHRHRDLREDDKVLDDAYRYFWDSLRDDDFHDKGSSRVPNAYTIFAPTNQAFTQLGTKLNVFLHSQFGLSILGKTLAYHTIPNVIFHSDYAFNVLDQKPVEPVNEFINVSPSSSNVINSLNHLKIFNQELLHLDGKANVTEYRLKNLANQDLDVFVIAWRGLLGYGPIERKILVKEAWRKDKEDGDEFEQVHVDDDEEEEERGWGVWMGMGGGKLKKNNKASIEQDSKKEAHGVPVLFADGVARAGAVHSIPRVLKPQFKKDKKNHDDKDDDDKKDAVDMVLQLWK